MSRARTPAALLAALAFPAAAAAQTGGFTGGLESAGSAFGNQSFGGTTGGSVGGATAGGAGGDLGGGTGGQIGGTTLGSDLSAQGNTFGRTGGFLGGGAVQTFEGPTGFGTDGTTAAPLFDGGIGLGGATGLGTGGFGNAGFGAGGFGNTGFGNSGFGNSGFGGAGFGAGGFGGPGRVGGNAGVGSDPRFNIRVPLRLRVGLPAVRPPRYAGAATAGAALAARASVLAADTRFNARPGLAGLRAESGENGEVTLSGDVPEANRKLAAALARLEPGVTGVVENYADAPADFAADLDSGSAELAPPPVPAPTPALRQTENVVPLRILNP